MSENDFVSNFDLLIDGIFWILNISILGGITGLALFDYWIESVCNAVIIKSNLDWVDYGFSTALSMKNFDQNKIWSFSFFNENKIVDIYLLLAQWQIKLEACSHYSEFYKTNPVIENYLESIKYLKVSLTNLSFYIDLYCDNKEQSVVQYLSHLKDCKPIIYNNLINSINNVNDNINLFEQNLCKLIHTDIKVKADFIL